MKIDLLKLKLNQVKEIIIDNKIKLDKQIYSNTDIRNIDDIYLKGNIVYHGDESFELKLNIKTILVLPCSITLDNINYPIDININEDLGEEENTKIINNSIDLIPIIWQNIMLEVPLKVVSENVDRSKFKGDGWRLITDEKELKEKDTRLEKLKEFLNE